MTETRLHLIRHALVEAAARTVFYGASDVALDRAQVAADAPSYRWLAARLPRPAAWHVTPLSRTADTAAAIFAAGYPAQRPVAVPALVEQHLGDWQGVAHADLAARLTRPAHPFWPHGGDEAPPGGETFAAVIARVGPAIEALADAHAGGDVVVVMHGGSIRAALAHALALTPDQALGFSVKNLGLTRLARHGRDWQVAAVNEEPFGLPPAPAATPAEALDSAGATA